MFGLTVIILAALFIGSKSDDVDENELELPENMSEKTAFYEFFPGRAAGVRLDVQLAVLRHSQLTDRFIEIFLYQKVPKSPGFPWL